MTDVQREAKINNIESSEPMKFKLSFNQKEAIYKSYLSMEELRRLGKLMNQTGFLGGYQYTFYTNRETKENFYQYFFTKEVLIKQKDIPWELTSESKKIGKYTCYKAVADMGSIKTLNKVHLGPVVAWYTPEIPISYGIQGYNGLPGLTLELIANYDEGQIFFNATSIDLNPKQDIKIKKPKGKLITAEEYNALRKKMNEIRDSRRN